MKKFLEIAVVVLTLLTYLASAVFAMAVAYEPVGNVVFSIAAGSVYRKVGEAAFDAKGYPRTLAIYKAEHKPFLIVGPCLFHEGGEYGDFFFVNQTQVVRTATDKGGDMWCRTRVLSMPSPKIFDAGPLFSDSRLEKPKRWVILNSGAIYLDVPCRNSLCFSDTGSVVSPKRRRGRMSM